MKLIVGLGNPGKQYKNTRHNLGFMVLDKLADNFSLDKKLEAEIARQGDLILAKPTTFMNDSGRAVGKICKYYKIKPKDIWVVHDDKDIELGKIRTKAQGSSGGHNGIASIIEYLETEEFNRIKMGTGRKNIKDTTRFVLSGFSLLERSKVKKMIEEAAAKIKTPTTPLA